ncbi:MAG TPA: C4-dicarboxylate ABC transporter substrate-binding protein, partial [Desulfobacteraceae bacterium]|nr:C4-dicarboxylate ABC transporter substrate-binding protein [Desulfobacteraceae bacterium]
MLVSESWYHKLDPPARELVTRAAKEAAQYEWKWAAEQDKIALQQCLDRGMTIHKLEDEPVWQERARSLWPKFYEQVGGQEVIDEVVGIMAK